MNIGGVDYTGKKVIVGLTGRMASCVAALLLKKQGMQVIGVSIVTNSSDNFSAPEFFPKCHITDLDGVKEFCDKLKIPFYATDGQGQFDSTVIDPLVTNKLTGQANSACFNCTQMRIDILFEKMKALKADYIATGHYCKIQQNINSSEFFIHSNSDSSCDQSYLLSDLSGPILSRLLLPLGDLKKAEVEKIAMKFKLHADESRETDEYCFKKIDSYLKFARERVPKSLIREGPVQNIDTDLFHGEHEGILEHYITQSLLPFKHLSPTDKNIEIVGYNFDAGLIQIGDKSHLTHNRFQLIKLNLRSGLGLIKPLVCFLKSKYSRNYVKASMFFKNNHTAVVTAEESLYPLIKGEKFIIYDRNTRNAKVIGSGTLGHIGDFELVDRVDSFRRSNDDEDDLVEEKVPVIKSELLKF